MAERPTMISKEGMELLPDIKSDITALKDVPDILSQVLMGYTIKSGLSLSSIELKLSFYGVVGIDIESLISKSFCSQSRFRILTYSLDGKLERSVTYKIVACPVIESELYINEYNKHTVYLSVHIDTP